VLRNAAGVVTINSTVGVTALHHGVPVKVLGNAVFNVAGLTCQSPLAAFWHDPQRPDPGLMAAFLRALIGATQVKGGYYDTASQDCAIAGFVERLERQLFPLPPLREADLAARPPRASSRTVVVAGLTDAGLSDGIGMALARAYAEPGVRVCLVGAVAETLGQTAADCRRRGALVETFELAGRRRSALADYLGALDRRAPVDMLVVEAGAIEPEAIEPEAIEPDGGSAWQMVAALGESMRCRGRGEVVLVDSLAGQAATGDPHAALRDARGFLADCAALCQGLRDDGISVVVVTPSSQAIRLAARWHEPCLATVGADRIAGRIRGGLRRHRAIIAVPGAATLALRVLRLVPSKLREVIRGVRLPSVGSIREPGEEGPLSGGPLPGETGPGD
jgi:short-subunit dehydrogenase